ncbi:DUF2267 domain-containing protein [Streptosporangium canum]|uniref:DUF2267 domain-containing protein n=1 Tax=Streptosporangium canum TaxID=324952 RepID=UPI0034197063
MDYDRFLSIVQHAAGADRQTAEATVRVTLETLVKRLTPDQARELAEHLPREPARLLPQDHVQENVYADEFLRRVAEGEQVDLPAAERRAGAVLLALSRAVPTAVFTRVVSELPEDFRLLVERTVAAAGPTLTLEEFLNRVAGRAGLADKQGAWRASEAVLEMLGEQISVGEIRDLMEALPAELSSALERGNEGSDNAPGTTPLEDFLALVALEEGVSVDEALRHARAVLATVRDAVTKKEFHDLTSQLARSYVKELVPA